jgi:hypothetical protein
VSHPVHLSLPWVTGVTGQFGGNSLNTWRRGSAVAVAELRLERPLQPIAKWCYRPKRTLSVLPAKTLVQRLRPLRVDSLHGSYRP